MNQFESEKDFYNSWKLRNKRIDLIVLIIRSRLDRYIFGKNNNHLMAIYINYNKLIYSNKS